MTDTSKTKLYLYFLVFENYFTSYFQFSVLFFNFRINNLLKILKFKKNCLSHSAWTTDFFKHFLLFFRELFLIVFFLFRVFSFYLYSNNGFCFLYNIKPLKYLFFFFFVFPRIRHCKFMNNI